MSRIVICAYRPHPGKRQELLELLSRHHTRTREQGRLAPRAPWLCEGVNGEIVFVAEIADSAIEAIWNDEMLQDIEALISGVARMIPVSTVTEAAAAFMDMASLPVRGGATTDG